MASEQTPRSVPAGRRIRIRTRTGTPHPRETSPASDVEERKLHTTPVQHAAATVAAIFGLVGLLGFLPGITAHIGALEFAGHRSGALLFGVFTVSVLHNVVHLLFAVTGLAFATGPGGARVFLLGGGAVYLLLALYGLLVGEDSTANVIPVNLADDWLHIGLGVAMIGLGLLPTRRAASAADRPAVG